MLVYTCKSSEKFTIDNAPLRNDARLGSNPNANITKIKQGPGIMYDSAFGDIILYQNDHVGGRIGLDKCIEKCDGTCVEYGVTGDTTCFPRYAPIPSNKHTVERSFDNETEDVTIDMRNMEYPSLR